MVLRTGTRPNQSQQNLLLGLPLSWGRKGGGDRKVLSLTWDLEGGKEGDESLRPLWFPCLSQEVNIQGKRGYRMEKVDADDTA